jgi:hypothetical protein
MCEGSRLYMHHPNLADRSAILSCSTVYWLWPNHDKATCVSHGVMFKEEKPWDRNSGKKMKVFLRPLSFS